MNTVTDHLGSDLGSIARSLEEISTTLSRIQEGLPKPRGDRPPRPRAWDPPEGDNTYQGALSTLLGLLDKDVLIGWIPTGQGPTLAASGTLTSASCADCGGPLDHPDVATFELVKDDHKVGQFSVDRHELVDLVTMPCGCLTMFTVGGGVAVSQRGCDHGIVGLGAGDE